MFRHESVVTSLLGATLGLAIGTALVAVTSIALADYGIAFALPVATLAGFVLLRVRSSRPQTISRTSTARPASRPAAPPPPPASHGSDRSRTA